MSLLTQRSDRVTNEMKRLAKYLLFPLILTITCIFCSRLSPPELAPERDFSVEDLLIDIQDFPAGWLVYQAAGPTPSGDGAIFAPESVERSFYAPQRDNVSLRATHRVFRYISSGYAASEYDEQLPRQFHYNIAVVKDWETPNELQYESSIADQFHLACNQSTIGGMQGCKFLGQYEEYLVTFFTHTGEQMRYSDIERILQAIDEQMAHYLKDEQ